MITASTEPGIVCAGCGTEVARTLLSCPSCHRLTHGATLKELSSRAEAAVQSGDLQAALISWRSSLDLLPRDSRQHAAITSKVAELSARVEGAGRPPAAMPSSGRWKWLVILGPAGLFIWKFKFLIGALLTKGKFLLLGWTKLGTIGSMLATVGVYWVAFGLWFAVGLVVSIYVHEMGHVAALSRFGIPASAPMFIPGVGALVRLKQAPIGPREDARVGLAGPEWGLGAAIAAALVGAAGGGKLWFAIAQVGAWINIFNLVPIWQLDGGRAFSSLTTSQRAIAAASLGAAWIITRDGLVFLVALVAIVRAFARGGASAPDREVLLRYVAITLALAAVFRLSHAAVGTP
jgi:Zn-dependent protease